ncbi:DNA replication/repair protein RecF [Lipingzhangella sp. LS1_29]|uniref:DNA replication and repair protein RecF n=1 Tax=Lipingzhangella rawalii TaxID=2055835 RepID=A0ABU2H844_9ACTN|nr:DNA replication/repair protein RecF [Lipingzhangella rawalii]MDS1271478.1 DNA replication/repair protein RecF [Lipingzhangella rawalii]
MYVSHLQLADFRSYSEAYLELEPGVSTFVGQNGQGKTNLMEAVGYAATLGSHRVSNDAPLVRSGAERAVVRVAVVRGERRVTIELEIVPGRANRARLNRAPATRPREVAGILRTVLFAPEDLALVRGDPTERRRYLDDLLVALTPRMAGVRGDYERILKQRNALLRAAAGSVERLDEPSLEIWDAQLAQVGGELLAARLELVGRLRPLVAQSYAGLAAVQADVRLDYRCSAAPDESWVEAGPHDAHVLAEHLQQALRSVRQQELQRGVTVVGPHRDDLVLYLGDLPARGYASQGESWSYALALRLAAFEALRADGDDPVLLLDDVFAELDADRRSRLARYVRDAEQVLVTAAVPEDVPVELRGTRFEVDQGEVNGVGR